MEKIEKRTLEEAEKIIHSKKTLRQLAQEFNVGKSTIHKDMQNRLPQLNPSLYEEVQEVFLEHIQTRHLRGGESTKKKYQKIKIK